jgi:hypothetical protein
MGRRFLEENRGNAVVAINYLPTHRKTLYGYGILLPYPLTTRFYGDEFIDARLCALKKDYARNSEKQAGFLITLLNKNGRVAEGVAQQLLKGIVELASSNSAVRELYGVLPPALVPVAEGLGMIIKQLENQAAHATLKFEGSGPSFTTARTVHYETNGKFYSIDMMPEYTETGTPNHWGF